MKFLRRRRFCCKSSVSDFWEFSQWKVFVVFIARVERFCAFQHSTFSCLTTSTRISTFYLLTFYLTHHELHVFCMWKSSLLGWDQTIFRKDISYLVFWNVEEGKNTLLYVLCDILTVFHQAYEREQSDFRNREWVFLHPLSFPFMIIHSLCRYYKNADASPTKIRVSNYNTVVYATQCIFLIISCVYSFAVTCVLLCLHFFSLIFFSFVNLCVHHISSILLPSPSHSISVRS